MLLQSQRSGSPIISNTLNSIIAGGTNTPTGHSSSIYGHGAHPPAPTGPSSFSSSFHHHHGFSQTLSLVTASSLSGEFSRISVCLTRDLIPVVANFWNIYVNKVVDVPIGHLNLYQILSLSSSGVPPKDYLVETKRKLAAASSPEELHKALSKCNRIIPLKDFLQATPVEAKLDISVLYPTRAEAVYMNLGVNTFPDLNVYVDKILTVLFDHVREVRSSRNPENAPYGGTPSQTRSVIFSSAHPDVCTVLNWKQPNYPVFFHANAVKIDTGVLKSAVLKKRREDSDGDVQLGDEEETGSSNAHAFSIFSAHGLPVPETDRRCTSLKEATLFAANNNLLGLIVSADLLSLVPSLVSTIRVFGLVLVSECKDNEPATTADESSSVASVAPVAPVTNSLPVPKPVNGKPKSSSLSEMLSSKESDRNSLNDAKTTTVPTTTNILTSPLIASLISSTLDTRVTGSGTSLLNNSTTPSAQQQMAMLPGVDGFRNGNVLKFKGAIDM